MSNRQLFLKVDYLTKLRAGIIADAVRLGTASDPSGMANALFDSYIKPILEAYQPVVSPLASHAGDIIYRARKCTGDAPFEELSDLYNPPVPSGRAYTSAQTPILYASSSIQTCLRELDPVAGETINIVQFTYSEIKDGPYWFIGHLHKFYRSGEASRYLHDSTLVKKQAYYSQWARNSWVYKDALFNEIFSTISSEADDYALNRVLIEGLGKKLPVDTTLQGVVFTSVKDPPGTNFAIFDESIKSLNPSIVNWVRIMGVDDYGFVSYELLKNAKPRDGSLVWPEHFIRGA